VSVALTDLWNAGDLVRWSNADGHNPVAGDDSGQPAGTRIGQTSSEARRRHLVETSRTREAALGRSSRLSNPSDTRNFEWYCVVSATDILSPFDHI
jgi:hypothetical protein